MITTYEFQDHLEAKKKAIELMTERKVMHVHIGKKRNKELWTVECLHCSDEYYRNFIKDSYDKEFASHYKKERN